MTQPKLQLISDTYISDDFVMIRVGENDLGEPITLVDGFAQIESFAKKNGIPLIKNYAIRKGKVVFPKAPKMCQAYRMFYKKWRAKRFKEMRK